MPSFVGKGFAISNEVLLANLNKTNVSDPVFIGSMIIKKGSQFKKPATFTLLNRHHENILYPSQKPTDSKKIRFKSGTIVYFNGTVMYYNIKPIPIIALVKSAHNHVKLVCFFRKDGCYLNIFTARFHLRFSEEIFLFKHEKVFIQKTLL